MKRTILIMAGVLCAGGVLWAQEADPLKEARTLYRTGGYEKAAESRRATGLAKPTSSWAATSGRTSAAKRSCASTPAVYPCGW